ncbi:NAD-dependent epimerase/dehydratase family protein [Achromobacter sp. Marseille-Q4962]|jgi:nucleoside-diphosphate-sugar epimerase|uniref:NAD-dependent epimerase/dehydratase family protein n=2 Tax=unclassified Achromobacter TaxID=2626865 RepID=UPI002073872F|nr:NAD-dependent epimerase/dehydratase family protein [Achromobacter sp. Marseille-Q4962]
MQERIFLAGATGAIGTALIPLLRAAGYEVYGSTRHADRAARLETAGVHPVVVDVFDAEALAVALMRIRPASIMHQLTDLATLHDPARAAETARRNARIRETGTRNLVHAASQAGAVGMVAQSINWIYAPDAPRPCDETAPLDLNATGDRRVSVLGAAALERQVLQAPGLRGTVLRYGRLYGPGTGVKARPVSNGLHVNEAARAALAALRYTGGGVFNIAEDEVEVSCARAHAMLGWRPAGAAPAGAG